MNTIQFDKYFRPIILNIIPTDVVKYIIGKYASSILNTSVNECLDKKLSMKNTINELWTIINKQFREQYNASYNNMISQEEYDNIESVESILPLVFIKGYKKFGKKFFDKFFVSDAVGAIGVSRDESYLFSLISVMGEMCDLIL